MNDQSNRHVLVIDDHREIREALRDFLQRNALRVSLAADAAQARQVLERQAIDLIVLDIMMPGEDGLSFCRWLRQTHRTPVIFLTAVAEEVDRVVGLELGADDYLVKPFNPRELLARIRAVLRRWDELPPKRLPGNAGRFRFAGWELDPARRELTGRRARLTLSSGELSLLLAFLTHPGTVLSRDELLDLTRGRDARAFDRSVDIQVSRLRRKMEVDAADPALIVTHRGGGYSLAADVEAL